MRTDNFPKELLAMINGQALNKNNTGMSGSEVYESDRIVLKIHSSADCYRDEIRMLKWLDGLLPVPKVLYNCVFAGKSYLLMTKMQGKMACDAAYLSSPEVLIPLLADALKRLWSVDISCCPVKRTADVELAEIAVRSETLKTTPFMLEEGFSSPAELLDYLSCHRCEDELVFSHGDLCLPNIFLTGEKLSGFIDTGDAGIADKWRDIALCWRSLKHNTDGTYGRYEGVDPDRLFDELGIKKDSKKLRYYLLLDELFH
ncbi:APH(3') family aminoglycoside O-phosphotransferase [uncultured Ruminococcus sp.]|uniref:APH(3') family aminoglycoside O-phosphotransferase n=1 Tax=uncultured Ruminococcus sp. TaxID=165186 RepID=UPI0025CE8CA8|nr:APH(3') family aminoglycoside O-phosphotransferase [uncultured Ruminococcus sp.]